MKDEVVEIVKSPEAPHLVGKRGVIAHKGGGWVLVKIGENYTHFSKQDVRVVKDL